MANLSQCFNCGAETNDWDYLGDRQVGVCDDSRCHRELREANRGIDEEAAARAREDGYSRYR